MSGFLKTFGWGVLYVVLLPFMLLFVALYMVYLLLTNIIFGFKSLIVFFTGREPFGDLKEDIEAKRILEERAKATAQQTQQISQSTTTTTNSNNVTYNQTVLINPNDFAAFIAAQAEKNATPNMVENQTVPQIQKEENPLFLESSEEKGENDNDIFNSIDR